MEQVPAGGPAKEASGMASALIIAKKRQQREEFQQAITAQEEGTNLRTDKFSTLKPTRALRCVRASPAGHQLLRCNTRQCRAVGQRALPCRLTGSVCVRGVRGVRGVFYVSLIQFTLGSASSSCVRVGLRGVFGCVVRAGCAAMR